MAERYIEGYLELIEDMDFRDVAFQMEDCHAWYYDAIDNQSNELAEVKVEKENRSVWYRLDGREDWIIIEYI